MVKPVHQQTPPPQTPINKPPQKKEKFTHKTEDRGNIFTRSFNSVMNTFKSFFHSFSSNESFPKVEKLDLKLTPREKQIILILNKKGRGEPLSAKEEEILNSLNKDQQQQSTVKQNASKVSSFKNPPSEVKAKQEIPHVAQPYSEPRRNPSSEIGSSFIQPRMQEPPQKPSQTFIPNASSPPQARQSQEAPIVQPSPSPRQSQEAPIAQPSSSPRQSQEAPIAQPSSSPRQSQEAPIAQPSPSPRQSQEAPIAQPSPSPRQSQEVPQVIQSNIEEPEDQAHLQELKNAIIEQADPFQLNDSELETLVKLTLYIPETSVFQLSRDYLGEETREKLMNTLNEILTHLETNPIKDSKHTPRKENTMGWYISNGKIFIKTTEVLGKGTYKKVGNTICLNTMKSYAISGINKYIGYTEERKTDEQIQNNAEMIKAESDKLIELHKLNIPNIAPPPKASFDAFTKTGIPKPVNIVKFSEGDYFSNFDPENNALGLDPTIYLPAMRDGLNALKSLHMHNRAHNDVKHENFMKDIGKDGVYLADFDTLGPADGSELAIAYTIGYIPPEAMQLVFREQKFPSRATNDTYAMGVVLLESVFGLNASNLIFSIGLEDQDKYEEIYAKKWISDYRQKNGPNGTQDGITYIQNHAGDFLYGTDDEALDNEIQNFFTTFAPYENTAALTCLGHILNDPSTYNQFKADLVNAIRNNGLYDGNQEKQEILFTFLTGLLHPVPKLRMTAEVAYNLIKELGTGIIASS